MPTVKASVANAPARRVLPSTHTFQPDEGTRGCRICGRLPNVHRPKGK